MPGVDGKLGAYESGSLVVAIVENLQEISTFGILHRHQGPVVEHEQIDAGKGGEFGSQFAGFSTEVRVC